MFEGNWKWGFSNIKDYMHRCFSCSAWGKFRMFLLVSVLFSLSITVFTCRCVTVRSRITRRLNWAVVLKPFPDFLLGQVYRVLQSLTCAPHSYTSHSVVFPIYHGVSSLRAIFPQVESRMSFCHAARDRASCSTGVSRPNRHEYFASSDRNSPIFDQILCFRSIWTPTRAIFRFNNTFTEYA